MRVVVLKLSGEALRADSSSEQDNSKQGAISVSRLDQFASQIARALRVRDDLRVSVVVGGGNFLRGRELPEMDEVAADQMGMLATIINSLAMKDSLRRVGLETRVMSGLDVRGVAEPFIYERARKHLSRRRVVVFAGGTGHPFVTTDYAAALRARELKADVLLVAKNGTNGIYDKDPNHHLDAHKFDRLSFEEMIGRNLKVMDVSAVQQCREGGCPLFVFDIDETDALFQSLTDDEPVFGTWVGR